LNDGKENKTTRILDLDQHWLNGGERSGRTGGQRSDGETLGWEVGHGDMVKGMAKRKRDKKGCNLRSVKIVNS
jgi:hypothetical protein